MGSSRKRIMIRTDIHKHVQILPGENFIGAVVHGLLPPITSYADL